jgi:hypothetical protein
MQHALIYFQLFRPEFLKLSTCVTPNEILQFECNTNNLFLCLIKNLKFERLNDKEEELHNVSSNAKYWQIYVADVLCILKNIYPFYI